MFLVTITAVLAALGAESSHREPTNSERPRWDALPSIPGKAWNGDLQVAPDGSVFVSYYSSPAIVERWDGVSWTQVGLTASCGQSWQNFLFFDQQSNIYLCSRDYDAPGSLNVHRKLDLQPWEVLNVTGYCPSYESTFFVNIHNPTGIALESPGGIGALRGADTLVVLFLDGPSGAQRPTAITRRPGGWKLLGPRMFSKGRADAVSLDYWGGEFWAAYHEDYQGGRLALTRYDRNTQDWVLEASVAVRGQYTALGHGHGMRILITNDLDPGSGELKAYRRSGSDLVQVGGVIATGVDMGQQNWIQQVSTAQDSQGRLYVAYRYDEGFGGLEGRIGISRLVKNVRGQFSWKVYTISSPDIHNVRFLTMDISVEDDELYVGYTQPSPQEGMDFHRIRITD